MVNDERSLLVTTYHPHLLYLETNIEDDVKVDPVLPDGFESQLLCGHSRLFDFLQDAPTLFKVLMLRVRISLRVFILELENVRILDWVRLSIWCGFVWGHLVLR